MATPVSIHDVVANGPDRYEVGRKQITLALGGVYVASTTALAKPLLVWETSKGYPRYYIPTEALHDDLKNALKRTGGNPRVSIKELETVDGKAVVEQVTVGNKSTTWSRFLSGPLENHVRIERADFDAVFENGALSRAIKNPYKRIDMHAVSPHIIVKVDGHVVAETNVAVLLNETGLGETYYLPATSIKDWGSVETSSLRTACPYKGEASYLTLNVGGKTWENVIWYYPYPTHESAAVEGLISFYNKEGVDIIVDGVRI
ncbi:DUF427-domain-containing protein [Polyplosphaeria fusca]|uniref:DUF427-domain-containing protein n=1 Tax=Polyplosphaeria fusca TaxID=682080 RepID=A0A9P4UWC6_9PLEO|nr:DUF427-domain-containing protein [Polyplosphaeria fusca]